MTAMDNDMTWIVLWIPPVVDLAAHPSAKAGVESFEIGRSAEAAFHCTTILSVSRASINKANIPSVLTPYVV